MPLLLHIYLLDFFVAVVVVCFLFLSNSEQLTELHIRILESYHWNL